MWNYGEDSGPRTVGVPTSEKPVKIGKCCHYWIIETPDGPMCRGVCKFCGSEKEFDSFGPDSGSPWERNKYPSSESTCHVFSVLVSKGEQDDS